MGRSFLRKGNCAPRTDDVGDRSQICSSSGAHSSSLESKKWEKTLQTQLPISEVGLSSSPGCFPSSCLDLVSSEEPVLEVPPISAGPGHLNSQLCRYGRWAGFFLVPFLVAQAIFSSHPCFQPKPWRVCTDNTFRMCCISCSPKQQSSFSNLLNHLDNVSGKKTMV